VRIDSHKVSGDALLLGASQAAKLLGISRKTLWNHTAKEDEPVADKIPAVRIGRVLRYRRETLERWILEREGSARDELTG
jgi:predicted DNA-binding transcriptional regulator AlpA